MGNTNSRLGRGTDIPTTHHKAPLIHTRLQELLPHRRQNSRLLRPHHPRPNLPPLPDRRRRHNCRLLVLGKIQRAHMAHHHLQVRGHRRLPRRVRAHQRGGPLHRHGHLHHRHVRRQLADPRVVRIHVWSDAREEGGGDWDCDDGYECVVYLVRLHRRFDLSGILANNE
jgi:hypothetical protein